MLRLLPLCVACYARTMTDAVEQRTIGARHRRTPFAALAAIVFEGWFVLALLALHVVRPDLALSRSMISQYAVGPSGSLMASAFVAAALALASLSLGLLRLGPKAPGARAAEVLFGIAVIGLLTSAAFPMDIRPPPTLSGKLHGISLW